MAIVKNKTTSKTELEVSNELFDKFRKRVTPCTGVSLHEHPRGFEFIRLHYAADPTLTTDRIESLRLASPSQAHWRREMEIEPHALGGARVYPEYDESIHVIDDDKIPMDGTLYMSIDPHPRNPHAFLWLLVDRWNDMYIYRDYWPSIGYGVIKHQSDSAEDGKYLIKDYAEVVARFEGNELEWVNEHTHRERARYIYKNGERIYLRFMDYAARGFITVSDSNKDEESYADRYLRFGINCVNPIKSHSAGEDVVHSALKVRGHEILGDWPRLHIASSCLELRAEMRNHKFLPTHGKPGTRDISTRESGFRTHQIDNLRYLLTYNPRYVPTCVSTRRLKPRLS